MTYDKITNGEAVGPWICNEMAVPIAGTIPAFRSRNCKNYGTYCGQNVSGRDSNSIKIIK
jgi:hypothetical protein